MVTNIYHTHGTELQFNSLKYRKGGESDYPESNEKIFRNSLNRRTVIVDCPRVSSSLSLSHFQNLYDDAKKRSDIARRKIPRR